MKRTLIILSVSILGALAFAVFVSSNSKINRCKNLRPGITIEDLQNEFGAPMSQGTPDINQKYFKSKVFGAGPIVATIDPSTKRVIQLKCSEDDNAAFTLK